MGKRSEGEWRGLFEAQVRSGMTERGFCREQGLCAKYFGKRKKQLGWGVEVPGLSVPASSTPASSTPALSTPSAFVRVEKTGKEMPAGVAFPRVLLRLGRCVWEFQNVPLDGLAQVMAALA